MPSLPYSETLKAIFGFFFPNYCSGCGKRLRSNEALLCIDCALHLPYTHLRGERGNVLERYLSSADFYPCRASSYLYYVPCDASHNIFMHFKYHRQSQVAIDFGKLMANDLMGTDFFSGIDLIVPVPLSRHRLRQRGYNQSERLAKGISKVTSIPVDTTCIERTKDNPTQTHLTLDERRENVANIFRARNVNHLNGKHILLVDDVITTGSTMRACATTLLSAANVKISVLSLGLSLSHRDHDLMHDLEKELP